MAGAEWGFLPGPSDCGGGAGPAPAGVKRLSSSPWKPPAGRLYRGGLALPRISLAGYNALIALALAALAGTAAWRALRRA